jgi:hypothetical protein
MREALDGPFESAYTSTYPTSLLLVVGIIVTGNTWCRYTGQRRKSTEE